MYLGFGALLLVQVVSCVDYGPVSLDSLNPITLSWNQVHWLVRDQIKEVEELKSEHDQIYNDITGCYGLEVCLREFDLLDIEAGRKLYELGLRRQETSQGMREALIRQRETVLLARNKLEAELRERERQKLHLEQQQQQQQEAEQQRQELERQRLDLERQRMERINAEERSQSARGSSSSSRWSSSSSSSYSSSSSSSSRTPPPQPWDETGWSDHTVFGSKPQVFERRYEYSSSQRRYGSSQQPSDEY